MAKQLPWLNPALVAGGIFPGAVILSRAATGSLGADPIAEVLHRSGLLALVFLLASLTCTPLRLLFSWTWPARVRRTLGLLAFGYACLHVGTWAGPDRLLNLSAIAEDLTERPFIIAGGLAFALLLPLALTSTNASIRRLGYARWQALHRLAYPAAAAACLHFFWRVKADRTEPLLYAGLLAALLGIRAVYALQRRHSNGGSVRPSRSDRS